MVTYNGVLVCFKCKALGIQISSLLSVLTQKWSQLHCTLTCSVRRGTLFKVGSEAVTIINGTEKTGSGGLDSWACCANHRSMLLSQAHQCFMDDVLCGQIYQDTCLLSRKQIHPGLVYSKGLVSQITSVEMLLLTAAVWHGANLQLWQKFILCVWEQEHGCVHAIWFEISSSYDSVVQLNYCILRTSVINAFS